MADRCLISALKASGPSPISGWECLKKMLPLKLLVWLDSILQPTGALFQFTPSVFLRARKDQPACRSRARRTHFPLPGLWIIRPWQDTPPLLTCPNCKQPFPVQDGIYDLRPPKQIASPIHFSIVLSYY